MHRGAFESIYDGHPDAWYTWTNQTGPTYVTNKYIYHNDQQATTLWYHDHTIGIFRLLVYVGLAGVYIIKDPLGQEKDLQLPSGDFDVPLMLMDRAFYPDGTLRFGTFNDGDSTPARTSSMEW